MSEVTVAEPKDRKAILAELKAQQDAELMACQRELSEILARYKMELMTTMLIQDGRISTQIGLRLKAEE